MKPTTIAMRMRGRRLQRAESRSCSPLYRPRRPPRHALPAGLTREALDGLDAREVVAQDRVQVAHPLPDIGVARRDAALKAE